MPDTCAPSDFPGKYQPLRLADKFGGMDMMTNRFLARATANATLPKLLLLTGPAGTGKGTTVRILARRHCCEAKNQHAFDPCLACRGCNSFAQGYKSLWFNEFGYMEFDAVRMDGEEILTIIDVEARYNSIEDGNRKMFCIDEIGRNRKSIQQRLLRLSETTRCPIVLCSISPENLIPELLDRFTHLALVPPTQAQAVAGLGRIAEEEGVDLSREAAVLIARAKANNPRRCIKTLGTAITLASNRTIDLEAVTATLEMEGERCEEF